MAKPIVVVHISKRFHPSSQVLVDEIEKKLGNEYHVIGLPQDVLPEGKILDIECHNPKKGKTFDTESLKAHINEIVNPS